MEYRSNTAGVCPYCNTANSLEYGVMEPLQDDGLFYYPWTCEHCGLTGEEWYKAEFIGHNDGDGNMVKVEK